MYLRTVYRNVLTIFKCNVYTYISAWFNYSNDVLDYTLSVIWSGQIGRDDKGAGVLAGGVALHTAILIFRPKRFPYNDNNNITS